MITQKYYWQTSYYNVKEYIKNYAVCLIFKNVCRKPYENLQSLLVCMYQLKIFLVNFMISLPILTNLKNEKYELILVIINKFTKMIYCKPIKIILNIFGFAKDIIHIII